MRSGSNWSPKSSLFRGGGETTGNDSVSVVYKFGIVTKVTYFQAGTRIYLQISFIPQNAKWIELVTKVTYF